MLNTTNYRIIVKYKSGSGVAHKEVYFIKGATIAEAKKKVAEIFGKRNPKAEIEELSLG